jgi:putative oxidoreductase
VNVLLWVLQVFLAVAFLAHGLLLLMPPPDIAAQMLVAFPRAFWLFLGVAEVAAAIGLTLPGLTRVMPFLVSWAAAGIMVVMVSATIYHLARGENSSAVITFILLIMATYVAYMRTRVLPILPRKTLA